MAHKISESNMGTWDAAAAEHREEAQATAHLVTAETASVWRLLSWRRSIFMRPTPKQYTLRSRSSRRPAEMCRPFNINFAPPHELSRQGYSPGKHLRQDTVLLQAAGKEQVEAPHTNVLAGRPEGCTGGALRQGAGWGTAGPAAAGCRTLGHDAGAALPERPVAGQKRLRQRLRRLVPDVVVCGRAPRQDVLHALAGVHQLLPHLRSTRLPLTACKASGPWLTGNVIREGELPDEDNWHQPGLPFRVM